jgi:hypothetical protein
MELAHLAFVAALLPAASDAAIPGQATSAAPPSRSMDALTADREQCFIRTLGAIQDAIRWPRKSGKTKSGKRVIEVPAWSPEKRQRIGRAFIESGHRHGFRPGFLAAFSVNESDLRDSSVLEAKTKDGRIANDSGLMAVRCILGDEKRWWRGDRPLRRQEPGARFIRACVNDPVRGMTLDEVLDPATNIEIAASILARLRDEGVPLLVSHIEKRHGRPRLVREVRQCPHKAHPFYAHYNWGTRTIETGSPRHYPHRIAVLYHAIAEAMDTDAPELVGVRFVQDKGSKPRRVDKPVGERQRRLFTLILSCQGHCERFALR